MQHRETIIANYSKGVTGCTLKQVGRECRRIRYLLLSMCVVIVSVRIPFSPDSMCGPCRGESVFIHVCVVTVDSMLTVPAL